MDDIKNKLINAARAVRENAYAPYSGFKVGAAILAEGGNIYAGCNVENASYGLTICAERNAIAALIAGGERRPLSIAIVAKEGVTCPPCGACRQVLMEFNPDLEIILESGDNGYEFLKLSEILPLSFSTKDIS
ncbi:MAG: cytidine deaminase [Synergistaceae bacterium]|nr:cytidine deaminase [Synergistaceae bacterium]